MRPCCCCEIDQLDFQSLVHGLLPVWSHSTVFHVYFGIKREVKMIHFQIQVSAKCLKTSFEPSSGLKYARG